MYEVRFYYNKNGKSDVLEYLESLEEKGRTSKRERVLHNKILAHIVALKRFGTSIGRPKVAKIRDDIWELRPMPDRVLFFRWTGNIFILLHHFVKDTQKIPIQEIETAERRRKNHIERFGDDNETK